MSNNEIVYEISKEKMVERIASKFLSYLKEDLQDFIQNIYLLILEMENEKLNGMYERGELFYYILYVIKAQATNNNSSFWTEQKGKFESRFQKYEILNENLESDGHRTFEDGAE